MRHAHWPWIALTLALMPIVGIRAARGSEFEIIYPNHAAPAYVIVSVSDTFTCNVGEHSGSQTILFPVGLYQGGPSLAQSRFFRQAPSTITLPSGVVFPDLEGNAITIVGSLETTIQDARAHMVTPMGGSIPLDVQSAFYAATRAGALESIATRSSDAPNFPTTYEIAAAILPFLSEGSDAGIQDIVNAVFASPMTLLVHDDGTTLSVAAEDDLFPHPTDAPSLFHGGVSVDEDLNFEVDVCLLVGFQVDEHAVNVKKQGSLPTVVHSTADFDAADIDVSTIEIGGVAPTKTSLGKKDASGHRDLLCHFDVPSLVAAGALTATTTTLTLTADLNDGSCVRGTSAVNVVSK